MVWVQLLPMRLPSHQVHVSLRMYYPGKEAAVAEEAAEWDKLQWVWLRLEVGSKGHAHVQLQASQSSEQKQ